MLVSERAREIIGLLLHNDKSLHAGTRTHATSILSCFPLVKGHGLRVSTPTVQGAQWNMDFRFITAHPRLRA